jgi:HlyD family secretion protein
MSTILKSLFPAGLCALIVLIVAANLRLDPSLTVREWRLQREAPLEVTLAEVTRRDLAHTVEATGKVEAEVEVKIGAEVAGRIAKLPVREGQPVRANDLLLQLDLGLFEAEARSQEAKTRRLRQTIKSSEVGVETARRHAETERELLMKKASTRSTVQDADSAYRQELARLSAAREELLEAESALAKAKEDLRRATVLSPIDGIVSQLSVKQGEVVLVGTMNNPGTVLMTVSEPGSLVARVRIDESKIPRVRVGQKVLIHPAPARLTGADRFRLTGFVKHITPKGAKSQPASSGGSSSSTTQGPQEETYFEAIVQLESPPPEVRMEMTVNVEILVAEHKGVLTIPAQAVLHRRPEELPPPLLQLADQESADESDGRASSRRYSQVVFVESDGVMHCRLVKTGIGHRGRVEVLSGLSEGERVITGPYRSFDQFKEGRPVAELTARPQVSL